MRLDDFCGHTKGWIYVKMIFHIGGIRSYIEIWMPMKDSWIAAPHSLCLCSVLKWRTEVVLVTKLFLSLQKKSPFRSQSFLNAHRQQKWWALHPICLQYYVGAWNTEPSLKWECILSFKSKKRRCTAADLEWRVRARNIFTVGSLNKGPVCRIWGRVVNIYEGKWNISFLIMFSSVRKSP